MKYSLLLLTALAVGMLLVGAVYAEEGSGRSGSDDDEDDDSGDDATDDRVTGIDDSTSTSDVFNSVPDISDDDLLEQEMEIGDDVSGKRVRAALGFYGHGYATREDAGQFVRIVGVHKSTVSLENERMAKSFTMARLGIGRDVYKLERTNLVAEEELPSGTMTFTVIKGSNPVGELDLAVTKRYSNGFVVRTGRLEFTDGATWDITVGMRSTPIKGTLRGSQEKVIPSAATSASDVSASESVSADDVAVIEPQDIEEDSSTSGRKRGFFARLFGWGDDDRSGSNSGSG